VRLLLLRRLIRLLLLFLLLLLLLLLLHLLLLLLMFLLLTRRAARLRSNPIHVGTCASQGYTQYTRTYKQKAKTGNFRQTVTIREYAKPVGHAGAKPPAACPGSRCCLCCLCCCCCCSC